MDDARFYFDRLYPFQDRLLQIINAAETDFYLTGGTAISRGYFQHRLSDDLDMFVNDDDRFPLFSDRLFHALEQSPGIVTKVFQRDERFVRATASLDDLTMKIELVNDVPAHIGAIVVHPVLGRMDSIDNIFANKITAVIDRNAPKDLADIWAICTRTELSLATRSAMTR